MKDYLQTVTGPVAREDMGLTLPHEHLFNDLSSVVDAPCYPFSQRLVDKKVTAEIQWALKHDLDWPPESPDNQYHLNK